MPVPALAVRFREQLSSVSSALVNEFDGLLASLQASWDQHGDIEADSISSANGIHEQGRVAGLGDWTVMGFDPAICTGSGSMLWTVAVGDFNNVRFMRVGRTVWVNIWLRTSTVGGTPSTDLRFRLPLGLKCEADVSGTFAYSDNGTLGIGRWSCTATANYVVFMKADGSAWAASTDSTEIYASLVIEHQEQ